MTVFDGDLVYDIIEERAGYCFKETNGKLFVIVPIHAGHCNYPFYYQTPGLLEKLWIGECLHAQLFVS